MHVLLSHSHVDKSHAELVQSHLASDSALEISLEPLDFRPSTSSTSFMDSARDHDAVVQIVSRRLLESRYCMRELLSLLRDPTERQHYRDHVVPIVIEDDHFTLTRTASDNLATRSATDNQLIEYWRGQASHLEEDLDQTSSSDSGTLDELRGELVTVRDIAVQVGRFLRLVTEDSAFAVSYSAQIPSRFSDVITHLSSINTSNASAAGSSLRLTIPFRRQRQEPTEPPSPAAQHLRDLYESISVPSEDDPARPEFPPFSPRFPATPIHEVRIEQLNRTVLIKDESYNFTGSHKDRMAWEIVVFYKQLMEDRVESSQPDRLAVPPASIISNGSAALAIQVLFRCFGLPPLKVLIDENATSTPTREKLERAGCEVFPRDLSARELDSSDVLEMTNNPDGYDFTSRNIVDPRRRTYYDWLAYEILNAGAKHIFIPVGTGDLYVNVLAVLRDELTGASYDSRLEGGSLKLVDRVVYGATSEDWKTKMDKLYAAYRPTLIEARNFVSEMRERGYCGTNSAIYDVQEASVAEALEIARSHKIQTEHSGIAGLGLLLERMKADPIPPEDTVLVVNTGWFALP